MFVQVVAYDPDLFVDFTLIFSQIETDNSQPFLSSYDKSVYLTRQQVKVDSAPAAALAFTPIALPQRSVVSATTNTSVPAPKVVTQIQSTFKNSTMRGSLAAPTISAVEASGSFVTDVQLEPLYDNIVMEVTVGALDLTDTKFANKPVAPLVG